MENRLAKTFGSSASPAMQEALRFIFETVPHKRGQCFIAIPLSSQPLFNQWVKDHRAEFERDFLEGWQSAYQGIAVPDKDSGFFCAVFIDQKEAVEKFLKDMNLFGTEDYLIIHKERRPRISAKNHPSPSRGMR